MIVAVVTFPGSNGDRDSLWAASLFPGNTVRSIFHKENVLGPCDAVVIPGGFAYGDYLRAGALAKLSPIMQDVRRFAADGGLVVGFCNGFQILCESGLLPGALIRNRSLKFISRVVSLRVENTQTPFTSTYENGQIISLPIAHGEGCYVADERTIAELEAEQRVVFRYVGPVRDDAPDGNPNGSRSAIAGIVNAQGNVLGLMPHPERATDPQVDGTDGAGVFVSMANAIAAAANRRPVSPVTA